MSQEYDIKLTRAIRNLKADTEFTYGGESPDNAEDFKKIRWITYENGEAVINTTNPHSELTWTKVKAEMDRSDAEYDANEYARKRQAEYPSVQDLVVALYDTDDKTAIDAKRAEIKLKYPKPGA